MVADWPEENLPSIANSGNRQSICICLLRLCDLIQVSVYGVNAAGEIVKERRRDRQNTLRRVREPLSTSE